MIRNINTGPYLEVQHSGATAPYINSSNSAPLSGLIRYVNQRFEVYDGNNWYLIGESSPFITLSTKAVKAIEWALKNMEFEADLEKLAETNPAIKAAHEQVKRATDQLKATIILSHNEETTS